MFWEDRSVSWQTIFILIIVYIATFLLVPFQIMLATATRVGIRRHSFSGHFRFASGPRMLINGIGVVASLILYLYGADPLVLAVQVFLFFIASYVVDFLAVEKVAKRLSKRS